ncbi:MAG: hypothetical protein OES38_18420 [Gammaproteobacteria bacterium]|nr:hypothetical protein [Gammaproteobacteria bacterium]
MLTNAGECVFNRCTKDEWPVGVIMSVLWAKGSFWITAGAHRHRISAIRRNPQVSIVVSGSCNPAGCPPGTITAKGLAVIHEDRETKDWFYPAFAGRMPDKEAAKRFEEQLDSPLRLMIEFDATWASCLMTGRDRAARNLARRWAGRIGSQPCAHRLGPRSER